MRSGNVLVAAAVVAILASAAMVHQTHAQETDAIPELTTDQLSEYQGSFEGRDIRLEGNALTYFREGMPNSISLEVIGVDHFGIVIPPGAQVQTHNNQPIPTFRFNRNEDGEVMSMAILDPSGSLISEHPKTEELGSTDDETTIQ